jgi:hypothetical protein
MKAILLLLASAGFAMTVSAASDTDPATKLVVAFTGNRWTTDRLLIATGTLTNTNPMPVTVRGIIATGFDKRQNLVAGGAGAEQADYTIGDAEIAPGATAIFKVALSDPKKAIRFVKATPLIEPIPTRTPIPIATPISAVAEAPAPTPEKAIHATVEELALAAWQHAKILPGSDGKYNWLEIGINEGDLEDFLHKQGALSPADDTAFGAAFSAIAHRLEERFQERAFENSQ